MRDCANCFHRKPVLKEDGTWTAECEKWDCEFQNRENMIEKTEAKQGDLISRSVLKEIWELYEKYQPSLATNVYEFGVALKGLIDNAPTVEPEKVLIANVTFDTEKLKELTDDIVERIKSGEIVLQDERIIKCKDCKHRVKEWREDRRMKDKGYWVYGCKHFGEIMGYWGWGGYDDEFCSDAEKADMGGEKE